jgi:hypothetical protein
MSAQCGPPNWESAQQTKQVDILTEIKIDKDSLQRREEPGTR